MCSLGGYPLGAQYDRRAPYNQPDPKPCPACEGFGRRYYAVDIRDGMETEVTRATYMILPRTEEEARAKRQWYARANYEDCPVCEGTGELYPEEDDDEDPFAEDIAMERYYESKYGND